MNPKDQNKARNKARSLVESFEPQTDREKELLKALSSLMECSDTQEFEKSQKEKQAAHWKGQCETLKRELSELRDSFKSERSKFTLEKQREKQKAAHKAAEKDAKHKEELRKKDQQLKQFKQELKDKTEEDKKALFEQNNQKIQEYQTEINEQKKEIKKLEKEKTDALNQVDKLEGQNKLLNASLNKDSHNSSKPSSTNGFKKKVYNNRVKSGNKPGGKAGHPSTKKELLIPDNIYTLDDTKFKNNPERYKDMEKTIVKQLLRVEFNFIVDQVEGHVYYDRRKHREVTPEFPPGMHSQITYDSSIVSFCMLLHTWGNVSYDKTRDFISSISHNRVEIAKSTLASFEKRFSALTGKDRDAITAALLSKPYLHVDGTSVRVNGKLMCVLAVTHPEGTRYYFSEHKGHEAAEKTALAFYLGTLIHDGEATFFKYGKAHQCCNEHELRYLLGVEETEPTLTWAKEMRAHIQLMIHTAHEALKAGKDEIEQEVVEELLLKFDEILQKGREEYAANPKIAEYSEGPKIIRRLAKNMTSLTYFLHNLSIPSDNNQAESALRKIKVSRKQNGGFRSIDSAEAYCDTMTVLESERQAGGNIYAKINSVMDKGTVPVLQSMEKSSLEAL